MTKSLKEKIKQRFREEQERSGNFNARLYKDIEQDFKEAVLEFQIELEEIISSSKNLAEKIEDEEYYNMAQQVIGGHEFQLNRHKEIFGDSTSK